MQRAARPIAAPPAATRTPPLDRWKDARLVELKLKVPLGLFDLHLQRRFALPILLHNLANGWRALGARPAAHGSSGIDIGAQIDDPDFVATDLGPFMLRVILQREMATGIGVAPTRPPVG